MPVSETQDTLLVITGIGINRWAARALTETLRPIQEARQVERSINGRVIDFGQTQFQKYDLTITCTDHRMLPFDGIWPGAEVEIECVTELIYPMYGTRGREAVPGSERQEGDYICYRPILQCVFLGFNSQTIEWEGRVSWEAEFTER